MTKMLFEDIFEITDVDPHGKKFDRVSRIIASAETSDVELTLDINTEIYPLKPAEKFKFLISDGLSNDPLVSERDSWRETLSKKTLADDYEYVMSGKVYKFDDSTQARG